MNLILFDDPIIRTELLPFTFTRPVSLIRVGILTLAEKWATHLGATVSFLTADYLTPKFKAVVKEDNLLINSALCPNSALVDVIRNMSFNSCLSQNGKILALRGNDTVLTDTSKLTQLTFDGDAHLIDHVWKIFQLNGSEIRADFELITRNRISKPIKDKFTILYGKDGEDIFVEDGATVKAATLNAENGPIYIGKNTEIQEGAMIRGPFALCEGSHVNMGAKIRGDSTVGPFSKVGGEISNSVIFGFSNKGHDGFLGNSVIGEWCNLGADTNTSNLKNNYENVKIWNYAKGGFSDTGLQFCGLMMGDHSKCGINTMFNTGTVVGVGSNIFGDGFPRTFIPSFAWGGAAGFTTFQLTKMLETTGKVMERRSRKLEPADEGILKHVFEVTAENRVWEKKKTP